MPAEEAAPQVVVREVPLDAVLPLRHRILRAGRPREAAHARQDANPATRHFAALVNGEVVGVVTLFPEDTSLMPGRPAMRLRGMAVEETWQGHGIGRALIRELVEVARAAGAAVLWANGRDMALGFYEGVGFRVVGDGFVDGEMHMGHHVVIATLDEISA